MTIPAVQLIPSTARSSFGTGRGLALHFSTDHRPRHALHYSTVVYKRFACFHEGKRKVSRDGHEEVAKDSYSAPPEYLGREVWVRWDARLVRLFNRRFEQIAVHTSPPLFAASLPTDTARSWQ